MSIKAKIEKILAKARGTDNEAEAATFLAKAEALMEEHQISIMDLGQDDPMGKFTAYEATQSSPTWKNHVLNQVAQFYGARAVRDWIDGKRFKFVVVGPESARVTTELMYPFIIEQIRAEGRKHAPEIGLKPEAAIRRVGNAFSHRISRMNCERKAEEPKTAAAVKNALVKVDALDAYMDELYPDLTKSRRGRGTSTNATAQQAAGRVSLHRQTGGGSTLRIGR